MVNPRVVVSKTGYVRLEGLKLCKADTFPDVIERLLDEHDANQVMKDGVKPANPTVFLSHRPEEDQEDAI